MIRTGIGAMDRPYTGISKLRPESAAMVEAFVAQQNQAVAKQRP